MFCGMVLYVGTSELCWEGAWWVLVDHWRTTGVQVTTSYMATTTYWDAPHQWDGEQSFKWLSFVHVCPVQPYHYRVTQFWCYGDQLLWGFQQLTRLDNKNREAYFRDVACRHHLWTQLSVWSHLPVHTLSKRANGTDGKTHHLFEWLLQVRGIRIDYMRAHFLLQY